MKKWGGGGGGGGGGVLIFTVGYTCFKTSKTLQIVFNEAELSFIGTAWAGMK